jgi:hypothetical protein
MNLRHLELRLKFLAKQVSIFDKGAALRAIDSTSSPNRILINYDVSRAKHIEYQEEGTRFFQGNKGYISDKTVYAITRYVQDIYNNNRGSETLNIQTLAQRTKTTPAGQLQFLRSIAR